MEAAIIFFLCAVAAVSGQILNPLSTMGMGMGTGWGNSMWHSGVRYPGMMQTSQVNSMTYPTWRSHPLFRMAPAVSEKKVESNLPSDIVNVGKVPSSQEVLTHMALAVQNPKPYVDTIADFLYEPQKTRTVLTPYTGMSSGMTSGVTPGVTSGVPTGSYQSLTSSPTYSQGMNMMRASLEDCGPDGMRWARGMDWLY